MSYVVILMSFQTTTLLTMVALRCQSSIIAKSSKTVYKNNSKRKKIMLTSCKIITGVLVTFVETTLGSGTPI